MTQFIWGTFKPATGSRTQAQSVTRAPGQSSGAARAQCLAPGGEIQVLTETRPLDGKALRQPPPAPFVTPEGGTRRAAESAPQVGENTPTTSAEERPRPPRGQSHLLEDKKVTAPSVGVRLAPPTRNSCLPLRPNGQQRAPIQVLTETRDWVKG